jgi:membrane associated rhomboid family serine protease
MIPIRDIVPSQRPPLLTLGLIVVNALAFAAMMGGDPDAVVHAFALVPAQLYQAFLARDPQGLTHGVTTLFTSMFLHGGVMHILGNMWSLWLFGDNVEDRMGSVRFLVFYLLCGTVAGLTHVAFEPTAALPTLGASGAVAGVMGAYMILYPRSRIVVLLPIGFYPLFMEWPAIAYLGLWFANELLMGGMSLGVERSVGGIAFWAHVGGFAAGVLLHWLFLLPDAPRPEFDDHWGFARPRRSYRR